MGHLKNYYIIEKSSVAVESIKNVFNKASGFNYIGNSSSYKEAMNSVLKNMPQLVFLNLDDSLENPLNFINELQRYSNESPLTIALSATKELAYEVIKLNFLDYLITPLTELDLRKSMLNAKKLILNQAISTVCIRSYNDYQYLNAEEILFLKADNNATDFHMKDGKVISAYKTLKTFEELLPGNFLRIHKSYIINSDYVSRINYGKHICTISRSSFNIPFTKTYIDNVEFINKTLSESSLISLN